MDSTTRQRIRAVANARGELTLKGLALSPGESVEVVVVRRDSDVAPEFPLRGRGIEFVDPTEPVAARDWAV